MTMRHVAVLGLGVLGAFLACTTAPIGTYDQGGANLPGRTDDTTDSGSTATATTSQLTVSLGGTSTGTVTSVPAGLTCNATVCTGTFPTGTSVSLTATPASGGTFGGWAGACTGTAACTVTMSGTQIVTATFGGVSGTWSGTYDHHETVSGGCHFDNMGNLSVALLAADAGTSISSAANITGLQLKSGSGSSCSLVSSTATGTASATLTTSGATLQGDWNFDVSGASGQLDLPFAAQITGNKMVGTWTCTGCTGTFTLTKQ